MSQEYLSPGKPVLKICRINNYGPCGTVGITVDEGCTLGSGKVVLGDSATGLADEVLTGDTSSCIPLSKRTQQSLSKKFMK